MNGAMTLIGFADPGGMSLGFLVPLFAGEGSNSPLVQQVAPDATIQGFEPYEAPDAPVWHAAECTAGVGEEAIYAFAFGRDDVIVAAGAKGRDELLARIDEPMLLERPMLAMELANFVGRQDIRCERAALVHRRMRKASSEAADRWRDLSVLTPDLRRSLHRRGGLSAKRLSDVVVARTRLSEIEILGVDGPLSHRQEDTLRTAVLQAVSALAPLYTDPPGGWRVAVHKPSTEPEADDGRTPDAAVLLASERAREVGRTRWPNRPALALFTEDSVAFTRVVEETETPLFVVYDGDDPERMRRASGDWTVREMHGIALETARPRLRPPEARQTWASTRVPSTVAPGGGRNERGASLAIRLAVAAELDLHAQAGSRRARSTVLLRARGLAPHPVSDGWAALYDRAWSMGLAPRRSTLLPGAGSMPRLSHLEPDWASEALFYDARRAGGEWMRIVMDEARLTAAILVDATPRSEDDLPDHRHSLTRILERQRWGIRDHDHRRIDARLEIDGRHGGYEIDLLPTGITLRAPDRGDVFGIDLAQVRRLRATGAATPGIVLRHLAGSDELVVGMRDLVRFDATEGTALMLVGAQLARMLTGLPSRSRTLLIAMMAMQAFRAGRVESGGAARLLKILEHPALGHDIHLTLRSVRDEDTAVRAEVRVVDTGGVEGGEWVDGARFSLVVEPLQVTIGEG